MTETDTKFKEVASLPADDPRRRAMIDELSQLDIKQRERWLAMMKETDAIREGLAHIEVPAGLEDRLLALPKELPQTAGRVGPSGRRWFAYAACIIVLIPVAVIAIMNMPRTETVAPSLALAPDIADQLAGVAVKEHEALPPLAVESADRAVVQKNLDAAMKAYGMPFPAEIPQPKVQVTLQGGGVCDFGPTHAVFTRWTSGSTTYTLYQFDGSSLNVPKHFDEMVASASSGSKQYKVALWPGYGNPCTWALVMEKGAPQAFD